MAGQRQPINLVAVKGKKHLTKAEIEERKNTEVVAPCDKVRPPSYLTADQKKKFRKVAKELLAIDLIANVDCDALARLVIAQDQYLEITEQIRNTSLMVDVPVYEVQTNPDTGEKERVQNGTMHDHSGSLHEAVQTGRGGFWTHGIFKMQADCSETADTRSGE